MKKLVPFCDFKLYKKLIKRLPPLSEKVEYYYDANGEFSQNSVDHYYKKEISNARKNRHKSRNPTPKAVPTPRPSTFEQKLMARINELEEKMDGNNLVMKPSIIMKKSAKPLVIGRNIDPKLYTQDRNDSVSISINSTGLLVF